MRPDHPHAPLHFSFLALHRQLEALGAWALHQSDPLDTLRSASAELDAQQVALWDLLARSQAGQDFTRNGLIILQAALRQAGRLLLQFGEMARERRVLKPLRKRLPQTFSPLQYLLRGLEEGLDHSQSATELESRLKPLRKAFKALHAVVDKRCRSGQNAPFLLAQYRLLWQLERIDAPLILAIEGLMTWQLGAPQRIEAASLLSQLEEGLRLTAIPHTRSGALVHSIEREGAILKQGRSDKLAAEHRNLQRWQRRWPLLVPDVLHFETRKDQAALMLEAVSGETLEHWLIHPQDHAFEHGLQRLLHTLSELWQEERCKPVPPADFTGQLEARLKQVWRVHPEFRTTTLSLAGAELPGLDKLLKKARKVLQALPETCAVPLHGDLNLDNILYDPETDQITLVDLNRAGRGDYAQDLTTLMASAYRLPNYQRPVRQRIARALTAIHHFARQRGPKLNDTAVDARLALGFARGLITSTRFVYEPWHARRLFELGQLLLVQLSRLKPAQLSRYRLEESLFHELP
ncbi:phosphotransferase [Sulfurivirga sp.]|uniref:phosphotransferase n=1 Tax=Sulfurivirga sp. TaxID=2614236 RepID=UPI0025F027CD|nr:phosphotransferase [Sulfurivirga sp.]